MPIQPPSVPIPTLGFDEIIRSLTILLFKIDSRKSELLSLFSPSFVLLLSFYKENQLDHLDLSSGIQPDRHGGGFGERHLGLRKSDSLQLLVRNFWGDWPAYEVLTMN
jgi:hypothetical protein